MGRVVDVGGGKIAHFDHEMVVHGHEVYDFERVIDPGLRFRPLWDTGGRLNNIWVLWRFKDGSMSS